MVLLPSWEFLGALQGCSGAFHSFFRVRPEGVFTILDRTITPSLNGEISGEASGEPVRWGSKIDEGWHAHRFVVGRATIL
jgi:hypothetical protein